MEAQQKPNQEKSEADFSQKILGRLAAEYGIAPDVLMRTLRDTFFKVKKDEEPFTPGEQVAALIVAERYKLDLMARQIYVTRSKGKLLVIVPIDGWVAIVNRQSTFDGCDFEYIQELVGETQETKLIGITCVMTVKGRSKPVRVTEWMRECVRDTEPWKQWPYRMLRHKAFIQCARIAFGLSAVIDDDELDRTVQAMKPEKPARSLAPPEIRETFNFTDQRETVPIGVAPDARPDEALPAAAPAPDSFERHTLWKEWCALRGRLKTSEQLQNIKRACGAEMIDPNMLTIEQLRVAVDIARQEVAV